MKLSLSKISFLTIIVTAITFSVVLGSFSIKHTDSYYENRVQQQEKQYIEKNKELVKKEVLRVMKRIETLQAISHEMYRERLIEKSNFINGMFSNHTNTSLSQEDLISIYKDELDKYTWDNDTGYFYLYNSKGIIIYHKTHKEYIGKNMYDLAKNNKELKAFIKESMGKKENFGKYNWYKPNTNPNNQYKKYVYSKKVDGLDIYIVSGIYKDELQKKVQNIIFKELKKERFGDNNYGYFWVHDFNHTIILHPDPKLHQKNMKDFKSYDGQLLFQNMNILAKKQGNGYINYIWNRPDDITIKDKKISYVHLIKDWNMVIGSGFYLTELKEMLIKEKTLLKDTLYESLFQNLILIAFLIFLSTLSALFISNKIRKVEKSRKEQMNMFEQYKLILDKSSLVSKTNSKGIITYVNRNFTKTTGFSEEEVIGKSHNIVRNPESPKKQFKSLWQQIQKGKIWRGIIKNKTKDGESYYNRTTIVPIKDPDGKIIEYISAGTDVTEVIDNRAKLKSIFSTDSLTGLGNRVSLIQALTKNSHGVLALINIDRFKELNDSQGHEAGDKILKEFSTKIFNFINDDTYTLYRVQGDIFALYTLVEDEEQVLLNMNTFMDNLAKEPYHVNDTQITLTYTSGIATDDENLLTFADIALSEAKSRKCKILAYDSSMNNIEQYKHTIIWVDKLYKALEEDKIRPYFQPIYNYHTNTIEKYECLMRLLENGEVVFPGEYLDVAKKTKIYPELTYKIVEKAINKFSKESSEFSINLSIEDLMNESLMNFVYESALKHNIFKKLVLEIVESEEIEDSDYISKTISKFKKEGAKIAIDDFGSGYSNYDYLISLQADYVKIDGSIVKHVLEDERTAEVIRSIVNFAKQSNMKTIAEFVSSKEIDEKIRSLGVDYAQGFYYGKAEPELLI